MGTGIGLREAHGLDDGASERDLADLRANDERLDWGSIPAERLSECETSVFIFDAAGLAFPLAAYMLADLNGVYSYQLNSSIRIVSEGAAFQALSELQRETVQAYVAHMAREPEFELFQQTLMDALAQGR